MPEFQDVTWEQVEAQRQRAQAAEDEVESMKAHVLRVGLEANAFAAELGKTVETLRASEAELETEIQRALELIPAEFVGNDEWWKALKRWREADNRAKLLAIIGELLNASGHAPTDPNLNDCTCDEFVDFVPASNERATCIHLRALAALMGA